MAYPKIEGERLDIVLQRLRDKGDTSVLPASDEFEALLNQPTEGATAEGSMESQLIDFIMPIIKDAGILQENRTIALLEHLRDQVLPHLFPQLMDASQPHLSSVLEVVNEEIARYVDLRERRQAGIAA
jgi:hypothetical protein